MVKFFTIANWILYPPQPPPSPHLIIKVIKPSIDHNHDGARLLPWPPSLQSRLLCRQMRLAVSRLIWSSCQPFPAASKFLQSPRQKDNHLVAKHASISDPVRKAVRIVPSVWELAAWGRQIHVIPSLQKLKKVHSMKFGYNGKQCGSKFCCWWFS